MALNIGNPITDRKNYAKTSRSENTASAARSSDVKGGRYTIGDLKPGMEFRASVSDVNNNTVKLRLSDGQQISARIDHAGEFNIGDEVTFTVKSNDGTQIDITPARVPSEVNPTLLKALGAAGLPVTPENLDMVKIMMDEQLPIDKSSIMSMRRQVLSHPETTTENLAQMTKFNIPITPENIRQFENYKNFENQISKELGKLSGELTAQLDDLSPVKFAAESENIQGQGDGSIRLVHSNETVEPSPLSPDNNILSLAKNLSLEPDSQTLSLLENLEVTADPKGLESALTAISEGNVPEAVEYNEMLINIALDEGQSEGSGQGDGSIRLVHQGETVEPSLLSPGAAEQKEPSPLSLQENPAQAAPTLQSPEQPTEQPTVTKPDIPLARDLSQSERSDLASALKKIGMPEETVNAVKEGNITDKELLGQIKEKFETDKGSIKQLIDQTLLSNKTYQKTLSNAVSKQWFLKPAEVGEEQKVSGLYEKLNRQMKQVAEQTANISGKHSENIMQLTANTSGNMDFMNHVNQTYAYVQIPVKLNGEDKQSDLYVFSNKKNLADKEGEIKALLHLDMDALGAVDAFMKLKDTKLDTKFTLDDDLSYKLFEDHISELVTRLEAKGYNCSVKFEMGTQQVDFVEDFMKQGTSVGAPGRLSFDVRA